MPNPYSEDLRIRAIKLVEEEGTSVINVAQLLRIGQATLYVWLARKRNEGTIKARKNWRLGHSHKIKNWQEFKEFVDDNSGLTAIQMAERWGDVTPKTIRLWLHKIGYCRKKRPMATRNAMKKSGKYIWSKSKPNLLMI